MKTELLAIIMVVLFLCTVIGYNVQVEKAEAEKVFDDDVLPDSADGEPFIENISNPEIRNEFPPNNWAWGNLQPTISVFVSNGTGDLIESSIQLFVQDNLVNCQISNENDGYNVSYRHENGFTNGELVRCRLEGETNRNHRYEHQWRFRADRDSVSFSKSLNVGWNLISIPIEPLDNSIDWVFNSIDGSFERIHTYDTSGEYGRWQSFSIYSSDYVNDFNSIELTKAYWIYMNEDCVFLLSGVPKNQNIMLNAGWNLVSYPTIECKLASVALAGTGSNMMAVYDNSSPYLIDDITDLTTVVMQPGEGYWVHVSTDTMWTVES
ncbi:MAG: hypothetical protein KAJ64_02830 [Thermoplasmata archaeon]|nr:hypothetical protein [Thermoplasmata archaeon]